MTKWIAAIIGGSFVFFVVFIGSGAFLSRAGEGHPVLGLFFAIVVPGLLGLAAGIHVFRASVRREGVRSFRLTRIPGKAEDSNAEDQARATAE
ncbi:MAG: hypothetical protein JSV78_13990 [Phycisphaerales bacterium]|nr:MAG: hypothetical protein JSV78_13990 [Phycisphaerales bacterium]